MKKISINKSKEIELERQHRYVETQIGRKPRVEETIERNQLEEDEVYNTPEGDKLTLWCKYLEINR